MSKCIVRIHRPNITNEERKIREEQIKEVLVQFYKETRKQNESVSSM